MDVLLKGISPFLLHPNSNGSTTVVVSSFLGKKVRRREREYETSCGKFKVVAEKKQSDRDRWKGLATDTSDDQQDITRGKGMVDTLFQAPVGSGTHHAVLSSYDYLSPALRQYHHYSPFLLLLLRRCRRFDIYSNFSIGMFRYEFDNNMDEYYIAPAFMDKLLVHIAKNFLNLPKIKVYLLLL